MPYNNSIKIVYQHINKINDVAVIVPTFKSAQMTLDTLTQINRLNNNINFDIIIADNAGHDYKKILDFFPTINFIVLENNIGSSGSQYIALKLASEYKYKYYCLTDNDAVPIDSDLLQSEREYLEKHNDCGAVLPYRDGRKKGKVSNAEFHFFMISQATVEKIGFPNSDYFLSFDDIDYSTRIYQAGLYIFRIDKKYYHPYAKPSSLFNPSIYFRTRGLLIFLFNKSIVIKYKYRYILYFFQYVGFHIFHSVTLWDMSIIKTITRAVTDFVNPKLTLKHYDNKFVFKPIDEDINIPDFNLEKNRLFLYYGKKFVNAENGYTSYFQLIKIRH